MVHRPTFDPAAHPVLTLSMCLIGVFYSDFENARAFGKSLGELLRRLLLFMVCRAPSFLVAVMVTVLDPNNPNAWPCLLERAERRRQP